MAWAVYDLTLLYPELLCYRDYRVDFFLHVESAVACGQRDFGAAVYKNSSGYVVIDFGKEALQIYKAVFGRRNIT